jgi:hypothetical protein
MTIGCGGSNGSGTIVKIQAFAVRSRVLRHLQKYNSRAVLPLGKALIPDKRMDYLNGNDKRGGS